MAFNQDVKALVPKREVVDPEFLTYLLLARVDELLGMVHRAGHGTGVLDTDQLQGLEIALPPLDAQRRIVSVLGRVDDLVHTIADLLRPHVAVGDLPPGLDLPEAARWVFSTLSSEVLRSVVGRGAPDTAASLQAHIRVLLRGLGVRLEGGQRP